MYWNPEGVEPKVEPKDLTETLDVLKFLKPPENFYLRPYLTETLDVLKLSPPYKQYWELRTFNRNIGCIEIIVPSRHHLFAQYI